MKSGGLRFWVIGACALLVGTLGFYAWQHFGEHNTQQDSSVSVYVQGVNNDISDHIVETLGFSGYLEKGGTRFAILQNQIVSVGETVTVKVVHTNYRLLVAGLDADQVRLSFIQEN